MATTMVMTIMNNESEQRMIGAMVLILALSKELSEPVPPIWFELELIFNP